MEWSLFMIKLGKLIDSFPHLLMAKLASIAWVFNY